MKVSVVTTNGNIYIFDNVNEVSKIDGALRVRHENVVQCFDPLTVLELTVDGKDVNL